ncbi:uncharacterized protein K02A2.6 [Trichonephila clavipes]|nr:uncharacterized protein K02A2.6 [Trichonephila clavipes]
MGYIVEILLDKALPENCSRCHRLKHYRLLLRSYDRETSKDIEAGSTLKSLKGRKFRKNVLEELHAGHLGIIVKMKAIARSFVYWKNIDNDIEEAAKNCVDCARYKADPPKSKVHYWEYPSMP